MTITVRLKFFASLREKLGEGEVLALPDGSTAADARAALRARGGAHSEALAARPAAARIQKRLPRAARCARR